MCLSKPAAPAAQPIPEVVEPPPAPPPPEPTPVAPVLSAPEGAARSAAASRESRRKGINSLRINLSVPGASGQGVNVPKE